MIVSFTFTALVGLYTVLAAAWDMRLHRIPNFLTVPAAVLGLLFHNFAPGGFGPLVSLAGFAVGFSLLFVPWLLGGGGMGDVKLLAALGAWLGPVWMLAAFALSVLLAAAMAIATMIRHTASQGISSTQRRYLHRGAGDDSQRRVSRVLPFAVPVALSTWLVVAWIVSRGVI